MERPVVIHGSFLGGNGLPGMLAFVGVIGGINAVLTRIWVRPAALTVWLILIGGALATILFVEAVCRRNIVAVGRNRIRWSFRQPPEKGDEPLSNLQRVEVFSSATRLVFKDRLTAISRADFRRPDINRLVETLRGLGAPINDRRISP